MTLKQLDKYLLSKKGSTFDYPFDEDVRVYRIAQKIFALTNERKKPLSINLKCDPVYALELRTLYMGIKSGYHMNKKHWNTVQIEDSDVDTKTLKSLIDHSYELVYKSLSKKKREMLE